MEIGEGLEIQRVAVEQCNSFEARIVDSGDEAILQVPQGGIVEMDSLGPCIGFVGYDRRKKIVFGYHFYLDPSVDKRIAEARTQLEASGIKITDCAVAGGNITRGSANLHPEDAQECREAKQRITNSGIKSYMNKNQVMDGIPADTLRVSYENKKFAIEYQQSNLDEEI